MALSSLTTGTTTRSTRSKSLLTTSTTIATTFTTIASTNSTAGLKKVTKTSTKTRTTTRITPRSLQNNEKENINPLTGQEAGAKKAKTVFGASKGNSNVDTSKTKVELKSNSMTVMNARPQTRSITSPTRGDTAIPKRRTRKVATEIESTSTGNIFDDFLRIPVYEREQDTLAGRMLAARRTETVADRLARELTERPLADLTEAFNVSVESIRPSEVEVDTSLLQEEQEQEEPSHQVAPVDLTAALQSLLASDASIRLPSVVRKRGIKRTLSSRASDPLSRASTSATPAARPTKRLRTSLPKAQASVEVEADLAYPVVPPNSPARSRASTLPSTSNILSAPLKKATSTVNLDTNDESEFEESFQDNTQGSSHFSTFLGGLGRSTDSFNFAF